MSRVGKGTLDSSQHGEKGDKGAKDDKPTKPKVAPGKSVASELPASPEHRLASARKIVTELAPRFRTSFDDVRVHTDDAAHAMAASHGGTGVAVGRDVYLGRSVVPESPDGRRVIAHELVHVVQQTRPAEAGAASKHAPDAEYEREAHEVGDVVAAGGTATPKLRTSGVTAQGFGSPEHLNAGDDVHAQLDDVAASGGKIGGLSKSEKNDQWSHEQHTPGASHAPGESAVKNVATNDGVEVPGLSAMLANDKFDDGAASLTLSLRNFQMKRDPAGPYLAVDTDPKTGEAMRYDLPVSPGDLTAMNGDLYGSMENMRKAPISEVSALQRLVHDERKHDQDVAAGVPVKDINFDAEYERVTAWREHPVFAAGKKIGTESEGGGGGDTAAYYNLALHNEAHFGEDTKAKGTLEVNVRGDNLAELAAGPQGNAANGNEQAWVDGHARALVLARESYVLRTPASSAEAEKARNDHYGRETAVPETGLEHPGAGNKTVDPVPPHLDNTPPVQRTNTANGETFASKLNDAYVENAGADHYLTDAFAAGHQIVRGVIGQVTEQFVKDKGGRDKFLDFVAEKIQRGALNDKAHATGQLGEFQDASRSWTKEKIARGESFVNSLGVNGLKQELSKKIDATKLRSIGAKLVHDYYNRNGMIVHNQKGMTFMIKGDGHAAEAPDMQKVMAVAVLESRNQVREMAETGATGNPLDVWAFAPELDKTLLTLDSGRVILAKMFEDSDYLWALIKDSFSAGDAPDTTEEQNRSKYARGQQAVDKERVDVGTKPSIANWLAKRHQYVRKVAHQPDEHANRHRQTVDGVNVPVDGA